MIESNYKEELEGKIDLYVNGQLNNEQIDELWAELIQDEYYLDYLKSVANIKSIIVRKRTSTRKHKPVVMRRYAGYGLAAAIALLIGVVGVMNFYGNQNHLALSPISEIGLDNVRSANKSTVSTTNDVIKEAIRLASNGQSEEAISLLQEALEKAKSPEMIADISLSLGSIQYNYGDYKSAIESFKNVIEHSAEIDVLVLEKGYWYLGNAYFQIDELEKAQESFEKALELDGAYSRIAKSYVDALKNVD